MHICGAALLSHPFSPHHMVIVSQAPPVCGGCGGCDGGGGGCAGGSDTYGVSMILAILKPPCWVNLKPE